MRTAAVEDVASDVRHDAVLHRVVTEHALEAWERVEEGEMERQARTVGSLSACGRCLRARADRAAWGSHQRGRA